MDARGKLLLTTNWAASSGKYMAYGTMGLHTVAYWNVSETKE